MWVDWKCFENIWMVLTRIPWCNVGARVASWIGWSDLDLSCFGGDSVSGHGRKRVRETYSDVTGMI